MPPKYVATNMLAVNLQKQGGKRGLTGTQRTARNCHKQMKLDGRVHLIDIQRFVT
jgi:hypothetical protein